MINIEDYAELAPQFYDDNISNDLLAILKDKKIKSILDCGCGDGSLLYSLNKRGLLKGKKIFAVDASKKRIKLVKKINNKIDAKVDNAEKLNHILSNSIDLYISTQVIEHVDDIKMISAMYRVLKRSGVAYITTIFKKKRAWYFYKNDTGWVLDPTHLREYTDENDLLKKIKKFDVIENSKKLIEFPLVDFVLKRIIYPMGLNNRNQDTICWKIVKKIKIPIVGYYYWTLIFRKVK